MSVFVVTAKKIGATEQDPGKVVILETEDYLHPINKNDGTITLKGKKLAPTVDLYEGVEQYLVALDPSTSNPYALDMDLSVSAAGTEQADATDIAKYLSVIDTATANQGVQLKAAAAGALQVVINATAVNVKVYPATGDAIDGEDVNTAIDLPAGTRKHFIALDATDWVSIS